MKRSVLAGIVLLWAAAAQAHKPSDSYLTLRPDGTRLSVQWDIALRDLDHAIGLDGDSDGAITWGEVRARQGAIAAYALARLRIAANGTACTSRPTEQLIDRHSDGAYAVLRFAVDCARDIRTVEVRYSLFFDFDPQHRGVLRVVDPGGPRILLFTADQRVQRVELMATRSWDSAREFWRDGVRYIWTGLGHVTFLLALLLPAVVRREGGRWHAVEARHPRDDTLKVMIAFTVAHSLTLSLTGLGMIHLPARWVESGIAASVAVAALTAAYPLFANGRWLMSFAFGLLHGCGMASAFADRCLAVGSTPLGLLAFNTGVESGQVTMVCAVLTLAFLGRRTWLHQRFPWSWALPRSP